ncbi:hypothetical protein Bca52824_009446 [Brassica carinata]|uniref:PIR2-like helical domain-containing protein n=1 Tax=Brassica carinata TaxID=52824 RepID=A0A8X7W9W6_BRACI|nr:hypothetical protein Bca52824_009446 [Brassica carinata]
MSYSSPLCLLVCTEVLSSRLRNTAIADQFSYIPRKISSDGLYCEVEARQTEPEDPIHETPFDPSCLLNKTALSSLLDSNPSGNFEDSGYGYCTEEQLEDLLLKHLEHIYNEAVSKLVSLGYDEEAALSCSDSNGEEDEDGSKTVFADLRQLVEYSLAGMVYLLKQVKPNLSKGDAMCCLLMSELDVGKASTIDIPTSGKVDGDGDCPRRFNLTPPMKCLLRENVAAFAAGYRATPEKGKDDALIGLLRQVQDLKSEGEERVGSEEGDASCAEGKQSGEESTVKRISEMESDLRKVSSHVGGGMIARRLENENAVIRAEIEVKLSESESPRLA